MMEKYIYWLVFGCFIGLCSCQGNKKNKEEIAQLVRQWQGKEVVFPDNAVFTRNAMDTLDWQPATTDYKVLVYSDSLGCISCKLQLPKWKEWMAEMSDADVSFVFILQSKDLKEMQYILRRDKFDYPVCVDTDNRWNELNSFPSHMSFQTFLLDEDNRVLVVGNPIHNPVIKELYMKQITGKETASPNQIRTTVEVDTPEVDLGVFPSSETRRAVFTLENTGDQPLVIIETATTCSCAVITFDKEPASPGASLRVYVDMTQKSTGFFDETITVKCNTAQPVKLKIKGRVN